MKKNDVNITLSFVGDLLCSKELIDSAHESETDTYNFSQIFNQIKQHFNNSDYVVGNLETPVADNLPYCHNPIQSGFNAPSSFLKALIDAGINMFITANNHAFDRGEKGLLKTLATLDEYNVDHVGTYASQQERDTIFIKDFNGVKIAFLAYTFGINANIHKNMVPKDKEYMINFLAPPELHAYEGWWNQFPAILNLKLPSFLRNRITRTTTNYCYSDLCDKIELDINKAKEMGADLVILIPHMGIEYTNAPLRFSRKWVKKMFKAGADVIICGHPHVLQPMEFNTIKDKFGKEQTKFVIYSLGNFVSSIFPFWAKISLASIILHLHVTKNSETGEIKVSSISYVPTLIQEIEINGKKEINIVSLNDALNHAIMTHNLQREDELLQLENHINTILTGNKLVNINGVERVCTSETIFHTQSIFHRADIDYFLNRFPNWVIGNLLYTFPYIQKIIDIFRIHK